MTVVAEQSLPHPDVPLLDQRQFAVQFGSSWVPLQLSKLSVQIGGVGLVLEMVQPIVGRGGHWATGSGVGERVWRTCHGI